MTIVAESNKATTPNFIPTKSVPLKAKSSKGKSIASIPAIAPASGVGTAVGDLEELVLAREDRRDRVVGEDVHDRLGQERRDREDVDLVRALDWIDRHRVRDRDLGDLARG